MFCADELQAIGWDQPPVQSNLSVTARAGMVRGMHYQHPPHAERKFVTCIAGGVHDILLDLRQGSPTFLQWCAVTLRAEKGDAVSIPPGVAHGFQSLLPDSSLLYFHSEHHAPHAEAGVSMHDPRIGPTAIALPLPVAGMSDRDRQWTFLPDDFAGLAV